MGKTINLSVIILSLMFMLLPMDMINGVFLKNNIILPLSIGQLYKLVIIFFLFLSFLFKPTNLFIVLLLFGFLLIPSFFQVFVQFKLGFLFKDIIKITRYLTPVFAFLFFVNYIKKGANIDLIFKLIKFSYIVFSLNILLKYVGLGYPMYSFGNVGSKGIFFAGNETSVVLIILSSMLAYRFWLKREIKKYFVFFLFTLFIGFSISSKTGMLGVILTFILIPIKIKKVRVSLNKMLMSIFLLIFLVPMLVLGLKNTFINSPIYLRLHYFWKELDFFTFIFSNRNNFFLEGLGMYSEKYSIIEKFIGVGQTHYELLNGNSIVEIDIADIFFAYGLIGLLSFVLLITYIWVQALRFKKSKNYPFSGLVSVLVFVLLAISTIAGHVFSSGMAAVFIGLLFSLMYIKKDQIENQ